MKTESVEKEVESKTEPIEKLEVASKVEEDKREETDEKKLISNFLSEIISDNELLQREVGRQLKKTQKKYPDLASTLSNYQTALKGQEDTFTKRLLELGGQESSKIVQGVETLAGVASGLLDAITQDPIIKEFRDNFAAFSKIEMSNQMLFSTAIAVGDSQTANLAKGAAKENSTFLKEIQHLMPKIILTELDDQYSGVNLYASSLTDTRSLLEEVWGTAKKFDEKSKQSKTKETTKEGDVEKDKKEPKDEPKNLTN